MLFQNQNKRIKLINVFFGCLIMIILLATGIFSLAISPSIQENIGNLGVSSLSFFSEKQGLETNPEYKNDESKIYIIPPVSKSYDVLPLASTKKSKSNKVFSKNKNKRYTKKFVKKTKVNKTKTINKAPITNVSKVNNQFIPGTCTQLRKKGLGNFRRGNPNYTLQRDGDRDGIACELR
jgi:hypothetical protein